MRGVNDGEILDFAAFAEGHDYDVRFIEFMPAGADDWDQARILGAAEILDVIRTRYDLTAEDNRGPAGPSRSYRLPGGGRVGVISPLTDHFCGSCNRLRLTAEGRLRTCLFSDEETDLREVLRSGADSAELGRVIEEAVAAKPQGHTLGAAERHKCGLTMSRVGG
ncbi:MAG: GTP 3',8-cyclase MoaA family protein [Deferrisomatales bacterium]